MCHTWWPGMPRMMNLAPCYDGHVVHRLPPHMLPNPMWKKISVTRWVFMLSIMFVNSRGQQTHHPTHSIVFIIYGDWDWETFQLFLFFPSSWLQYSSWIIQRFNLELISFHLKERHERQQQEMLGARHRLWSSATKKSLQTYDIRHFGRLSYLVWHQVNDI